MKAWVLDPSEALQPFEVRPTTSVHVDAYDDRPTMRAGMTIGMGSSFVSLGT